MEQLVEPDRALDIVLANVPTPAIESCPASEALGRTLARSVETPEDIPPSTGP